MLLGVALLIAAKSVAIIIVNWNGLKDTMKCLDSLLTLTYPYVEIIVVDNGSRTNEAEMLKEYYGNKIHTIRNSENNGYSAGINSGIKYLFTELRGSDYLLIANNDITFKSNFLDGIIRYMESNSEAGVVAGKILILGTKNVIYSVGQKWSLKTGVVRNIGFGKVDRGEHSKICEIDFVSGAAFVIRRSVLEKVGLFDEGYFLYFEEPDYCLRAKRAGYRSFLIPCSVAFHKSASSTKKIGVFAYYHYEKSHLRFIVKHFTGIYFPIAFTVNSMRIFVNGGASCIKYKNFQWLYFAAKAINEALVNAKKTRSIQWIQNREISSL